MSFHMSEMDSFPSWAPSRWRRRSISAYPDIRRSVASEAGKGLIVVTWGYVTICSVTTHNVTCSLHYFTLRFVFNQISNA
eukprot:1346607-Amorphochlora_amoeboformis.AAC.3